MKRAIICLQSPFAYFTLQTIRPKTARQVRRMIRGVPLFAFSPTAHHVHDLRKHAATLGHNEVQFTGPLDLFEGETIVVYAGDGKGMEVAVVRQAA